MLSAKQIQNIVKDTNNSYPTLFRDDNKAMQNLLSHFHHQRFFFSSSLLLESRIIVLCVLNIKLNKIFIKNRNYKL